MASQIRHKFLRPSEKFLLGASTKADVQRLREVLEKENWEVTDAGTEALEGMHAIWVGPPPIATVLERNGFTLEPPATK